MPPHFVTFSAGIIVLALYNAAAFSVAPLCGRAPGTKILVSETALYMGKSRKARRMQKVEKQGKSRPAFFDAIEEDTEATPKKVSPPDDDEDNPTDSSPNKDAEREARMADAKNRMEQRPDVSTMIIDEETGIEVVAQGKAVMDVVTRKAVKLLAPEYRLAQMFPGVPPDIREACRFDWSVVEVPQMVQALREACVVKLEDGSIGIPPHPSVANKAIDFVLANKDYLSFKMKRTLGRLQMRSLWKGNLEDAREYDKLWKNFLTLENHISAPFRQIMMDAEGRVGPNFGNLDIKSFCDGELYERIANYLVLKGMVAHWEKKVKDAVYVESNPQTEENFVTVLATGDPKRYLPQPPILFTLRECTQVVTRAREMCQVFVDTADLFQDFPPEIRFLETALTIKGGTALRKYMVEDFCPAEEITPEALREGMRRLYTQLENMQIDPYGDLTNIIDRLINAMSVGTSDERDPYAIYLANPDPEGPGYFQTYTFNHGKLSLVRFLDNQYERVKNQAEMPSFGMPDFFGMAGQSPSIPNFGGPQEESEEVYKVPELRAAGRPHELGWLDLLENEDEELLLGRTPAGRIIPDS